MCACLREPNRLMVAMNQRTPAAQKRDNGASTGNAANHQPGAGKREPTALADLLFCVGGIYGAFLCWGYLQVRAWTAVERLPVPIHFRRTHTICCATPRRLRRRG